MSVRRILRLMAGQIKSPAERAVERETRRDKRVVRQLQDYLRIGEVIERRQRNDPSLPPMPFDFAEMERRRKEGK